MYRAILCFLILISSVQPLWADTSNDGFHVLKGRIIRSLAIEAKDPTHILVGQKAKAPGSALVFQSRDGGKSWRTLNGTKSLHTQATDVQAVVAVSKQTFLAGTWKHGLYLSDNGGRNFNRVPEFPSSDIRDLQVADGVIYAATARQGIFESKDHGRTWKSIGPGQNFIWSMTLTESGLFASSPENIIYERLQAGGPWQKIFKSDGANAIAITPGSGGLRSVAGAKGLYVSMPGGWHRSIGDENFADVLITQNNRIIAGSWDNGIAVITSGGRLEKRSLEGKPVVHLQIANRRLYAGTWGDGLHVIPVRRLLTRSINDTPLITAVLIDDLGEVKRLIGKGVEIDAFDSAHNTALIFAARDGQTEIAQLLINAGADPGWVDAEGVTPLILAAFKGHPDIVKLLLAQKNRARREQTDKSGRTARDYAKQRGAKDAVYKILVE